MGFLERDVRDVGRGKHPGAAVIFPTDCDYTDIRDLAKLEMIANYLDIPLRILLFGEEDVGEN